MISLIDATLSRGDKPLLDDTSLTIHKGQKIGIVGRNGTGKTSLFGCLLGQLPLDQGQLLMPEGLRCAQMLQETAGSSVSALDYVIDGDTVYRDIEARLRKAEQQAGSEAADHALARLHGELDKIGGYDIRNRAEKLLSGLRFEPAQFGNPVSSFSGGWRIRLNLAAALMAPSDLLLLDEPTNHLDLEASLWLEQWLIRYEGTLLIISHDRSFLDRVVSHIVSLENRKLELYRGNYSSYETQRGERLAQEQALYEKQLRRKSEIEDFVRRFRAKATKARQAQSRLKELDRMQLSAPAHIDSPFQFAFYRPDRLPGQLMKLDQVAIGFDRPLVDKIRLGIQSSTRIGLLGFNGSGKSTLLKVMAGQLESLAGELLPSKHLKAGYFAQHQVDVLDIHASPMALVQRLSPQAREQEIRNFLGGFDFRGDRVTMAIDVFSGGEKARMALALIVWQKPNLLLLDEPTNHLDLEMRHALTVALQGFEGAVVIVSHDRHLLNNTVDEFYSIHDGQFRQFEGDLNDYEKWLGELSAQNAREAKNTREDSQNQGATPDAADERKVDKKELRQQAAAHRQQMAPLRQEVRKLEKEVDRATLKLSELDEELADTELYKEENKQKLSALLLQQGRLKSELAQLEDEWLDKSEQLEQP